MRILDSYRKHDDLILPLLTYPSLKEGWYLWANPPTRIRIVQTYSKPWEEPPYSVVEVWVPEALSYDYGFGWSLKRLQCQDNSEGLCPNTKDWLY